MLTTRLIPVLFLMNGLIVRAERFSKFQVVGNPYSELERYSEWLVDELVYIDITRDGEHNLRRSDHKVRDHGTDTLSILREISRHAFMPLTFGGRIRTLEEVDAYMANGADKIIINSQAYRSPDLIESVAKKYGAQAMAVGLDGLWIDGAPRMAIDQGNTIVDDDPVEYARRVEGLGAGELFLNSVERDGTGTGYDVAFIEKISSAVSIPVVACGGVGTFEHFPAAITQAGASAMAAGNIFHFTENSYKRAKRTIRRAGIDVRYPYPS